MTARKGHSELDSRYSALALCPHVQEADDELAVIGGLTSPSDRVSGKSLCYSCCRYCFLTTSTLSAISCAEDWQMEAGEMSQL